MTPLKQYVNLKFLDCENAIKGSTRELRLGTVRTSN